MSKKSQLKKIAGVSAAALTLGLASGAAMADQANPFGFKTLESGYMTAMSDKPSEGKCGAAKSTEAKCGASKSSEAKCGAAKSTEAKCGANK